MFLTIKTENYSRIHVASLGWIFRRIFDENMNLYEQNMYCLKSDHFVPKKYE